MTHPTLSVVIVTYNSADTINTCLTCLSDALKPLGGKPQVIVWDNASIDDTVRMVENHPISRERVITLVASPDNAGFGGANNAAAAQATGDVLLLLNPDAFLDDPMAIDHLLTSLRETDAVIVGPFLENADGSHQVGDAGHRETVTVAISWAFGLNLLPGMPGAYLSRTLPRESPPVLIDWVCGACLMIERRVFLALGGFDARIFLYSEDVDLCLRAGRLGKRVAYVPAVRVRHVQGASLPGKDVSTTWLDSRFGLFSRAYGTGTRYRLFAIVLAFGFGWRAIAYRVRGTVSPVSSAAEKAVKMSVYARFSLRRAIPHAQN